MTLQGEKLIGIYCPSCGEATLDVVERVIVCTSSTCERPMAASEILAQAEEKYHVVTVTETSFTIMHPLNERLDNKLHECDLHRQLQGMPGPPGPPGKYKASRISERGWAMVSEISVPEILAQEMAKDDDPRWRDLGTTLGELFKERKEGDDGPTSEEEETA